MKFKVLVLIFDTSLPITFVSLNTCVNWDARSREMKRSNFLILNYLITLCCISVPFQKFCPRDFFPLLSLTITDTNTLCTGLSTAYEKI